MESARTGAVGSRPCFSAEGFIPLPLGSKSGLTRGRRRKCEEPGIRITFRDIHIAFEVFNSRVIVMIRGNEIRMLTGFGIFLDNEVPHSSMPLL